MKLLAERVDSHTRGSGSKSKSGGFGVDSQVSQVVRAGPKDFGGFETQVRRTRAVAGNGVKTPTLGEDDVSSRLHAHRSYKNIMLKCALGGFLYQVPR